jgi:hypothetical protein
MNARRVIEDPVTIEVDGSTVLDPEDGKPLTAVLVRMPAYFAEHLAQVLTAWTSIGELIHEWSGDESGLAEGLLFAARAARQRDEASPELLLQRVRDLLAEYRMAVQEQEHDRQPDS